MSFASSAVTYTSIYTDSEPGRPVAPPSPDYIPGPEEPHTPLVPQDKDELEPMFIQPHDPDYVPEIMYLEYIPLEDEHVFLVEEQPLPHVDSPTTESPGYVAESDHEEDPEEYEDDEIEDGPVDYLVDGGYNGDDDDGDSSRDDADDNDEDEEDDDEKDDDEEEEHLAPADSTVVVPTVEPVSPPEGIEPASISLPPEAEVERLLAMPTPSLSPPISLSPPSAGECLARIASTQALVDVVTAVLPLPPLPPLPPSLYIPPPVNRRDDIPKPIGGRGVDYGFVSTLDAEERRRGIREVGYGIRDTWVDPLEAVPEIAPMTVGETQHQVHETRSQMQQAEMAELRETDYRCQSHIVETFRVMRDIRREIGDMQAKLLALREQQRRARQPGPDVRVLDHQDASRDADSHI
ncbi:hypothetical protein Tco_0555474 [Tanacetum coccineum]